MKRNEYFQKIEQIFYSPNNLEIAKEFSESVMRSLPTKKVSAFEMGCGYGLAASMFINVVDGLRVYDIDEDALEYVKCKFKDKILIAKDASYIASDSLIYFFLSLHHIEDYRDKVEKAIAHILKHSGTVAICELEPLENMVFHKYETSPHDGIHRSNFQWIDKKYPELRVTYKDLPEIKAHNVKYKCYSLIIQND